MPLLIFLLYPVVEIFLFVKFVQTYSFLDGFLLIISMFFLGIFIMKSQGAVAMMTFQSSMAKGQLPGSQILHRSVVIVGGLLLMIPGFLSDILGLICILPGTRHLIVLYLKYMFAKGLLKGAQAFNFQFGNFGRAGGFRNYTYQSRNQRPEHTVHEERDATVIDVTPIEISHQRKED